MSEETAQLAEEIAELRAAVARLSEELSERRRAEDKRQEEKLGFMEKLTSKFPKIEMPEFPKFHFDQ